MNLSYLMPFPIAILLLLLIIVIPVGLNFAQRLRRIEKKMREPQLSKQDLEALASPIAQLREDLTKILNQEINRSQSETDKKIAYLEQEVKVLKDIPTQTISWRDILNEYQLREAAQARQLLKKAKERDQNADVQVINAYLKALNKLTENNAEQQDYTKPTSKEISDDISHLKSKDEQRRSDISDR